MSCDNFYSYNKKECLDEIPRGYYLYNSSLKTINKCPNKCQLCSDESIKNNLCISCNNDYSPIINNEPNINLFIDCIKNCPSGYININDSCEINNDGECSALNFLNNLCGDENYYGSQNIEDIINKIKKGITSQELKALLSNVTGEQKKDIEIYKEDIYYQITSSYNQNNKQYNNISIIKLNQCEDRLKTKYNISEDESLIIFKVDILQDGLLIPKVEYEVYHPLTLEKLELDICNNITIEISLPVSINEDELYRYNTSSDFYNDKCFPYTSENGTDMTLSDRQNDFINQNLSLCEKNCDFIGYDNNTKYASCDCQIKNVINIYGDIVIDKDKLLNNFVDVKSIMNLEVMKCYKILFNEDGLLKNIGSYILLFSIFIFIISIFIFIFKDYKTLINQINNIIKENQNKFKYINSKTEHDVIKKRKKKFIYSHKTVRTLSNKKLKIKKKRKKKKLKKTNSPARKKRKRNLNSNSDINIFKSSETYNAFHKSSKKNTISNLKNKDDKENKVKINMNVNFSNDTKEKNNNNISYNDYELNSLTYVEALKYDNRTYFQYYFSLLKARHLFFFAFYPNNDYNSQIIKILLFLFSFDLYYTINALFFTEGTIHEIHQKSGKYDFIYHLPQIFYSTIISSVINIIIKFFSLTQKNILDIKSEKDINIYKNKLSKLLKCLKIRFICFYILSFIFLILFWYYLSCFCAVYRNTQLYLIKDTLISFGISLLYPFAIVLIPGFFRIPSLRNINQNKECLYNFSKIIQLF